MVARFRLFTGSGPLIMRLRSRDSFFTFPTDGKPIKATLASPDFITSKPSPCK